MKPDKNNKNKKNNNSKAWLFILPLILVFLGIAPHLEARLHECEPLIKIVGMQAPFCITAGLNLLLLPGFLVVLPFIIFTRSMVMSHYFIWNILIFILSFLFYSLVFYLIHRYIIKKS